MRRSERRCGFKAELLLKGNHLWTIPSCALSLLWITRRGGWIGYARDMDPLHIFLVVNVAIELIAIVRGAAAIQAASAQQTQALERIADIAARNADIAARNERLSIAILGRLAPPQEPPA